MIKTGILGGTYNPVHNGHIDLATQAIKRADLDEVWLVPSNVPPHRNDTSVSALHRFNMCKLATENYSQISISDVEFKKDDISYAYITVRDLNNIYSNREFYYIIGVDAALLLDTWKHPDEFIKNTNLLIFSRPGYAVDRVRSYVESSFLVDYKDKISIVSAKTRDISSTQIRERLSNGLAVNDLISDAVIKYIKKNNLYIED